MLVRRTTTTDGIHIHDKYIYINSMMKLIYMYMLFPSHAYISSSVVYALGLIRSLTLSKSGKLLRHRGW